jgi:uncharacterized damage-inducible protein DinB
MIRRVSDFLEDWAYEREATLKILHRLTDASLGRKVCDEGRTMGYLAWHLVLSMGEMMRRTGLSLGGPPEDSPAPASALAIAEAYEAVSEALEQGIQSTWTDEILEKEDEMYGERWKRGKTLGVLILHQAHHRAQLTVLMRQAGLKVPGVYGPSREEWQSFGLQPLP